MDFKSLCIVFLVILIVLIVIILLGIREKKNEQIKFNKLLSKRYGKRFQKALNQEKIKAISGYFNKHKGKFFIDDITWSDLSMDNVYSSMNNTYSSAGEEYLYYMLRTPLKDIEKLKTIDRDIEYFIDNKKVISEILTIINTIGKLKNYSIYDYLTIDIDIEKKSKNTKHYILIFLLIASFILLFFKTGIGIILLFLLIAISIFDYFKTKTTIIGYLNSFKYIMRLYNAADLLVKRKDKLFGEAVNEKVNVLLDSVNKLKSFSKYSKYVFTSMSDSGTIFDLILSYINMVLHIDLIFFNLMIKKFSENVNDVDNLVSSIGYIDSVIAIGSYRLSFAEAYSKPIFFEDSTDMTTNRTISFKDIYHPLLEKAVKNSGELEKCVLITGSNASGKSTFLKTIAINQLLAETIYTVLASEYKSYFCRIYSSMALHDDIIKGDSYYMAEIKALKRILEANNSDDLPILCFVDEVLRGTNTVERIAASTKVLEFFADNNIKCIAATHDIELTDLLEKKYENYHFSEDIIDSDIFFNYKLTKGKATSRNAIKLLELIGYDKSIVNNAKELATLFVSTGSWMN